MSRKGLLLIISGFSGAGKGTVIRKLMEEGGYWLSVSATTRAPREGEEDGREYFFLTREEFEKRVEEGRFLEWAQFSGNYYGTPLDSALEHMEAGRDVILEIEAQGALQVKAKYPEAVLIFMVAPSMRELVRRLTGRGTESAEQVARRFNQAKNEIEKMHLYDFVVVNDDVEACAACIKGILEAMRERSCHKQELIDALREEAKTMEPPFSKA